MNKSKILFAIACTCLIASAVYAETDYKALEKITNIQRGKVSLGTPVVDTITVGSGVTGDVTGDVSGNIDAATAAALTVGAATATSVEIADTTILTDIQGTLSVDEDAVFDADVKGLTFSIGSGSLERTGNALNWVEGGVTNVLDADVTTP
jgi:hypothetical protein